MAWFDGFDDDGRAYVASKGWDRLAPEAAAMAVVKSYREIERMRPDPARTLTLPADLNDAAAMAPILQRLDPVLKARDEKLAAEAKTAADAAAAAKVAADTEKLKAAWGTEADAKTAVAQRAFEALGLDKTVVDAMVATVGVDKLMEAGYGLGTKMGEATLLKGTDVSTQTPKYTRETALAERNRLTSDATFGAKVMAGEAEALAKLEELSRAIVGTPQDFSAPPPNFGRTKENPNGPQPPVA